MKRWICIPLLFCALSVAAQRPHKYLKLITSELGKVETLRDVYAASVARAEKPLETERKRRAFLQATAVAVNKVGALRPFAGDSSLRDAMLRYLSLTFACANDEFVAVSDMQAISELSFDAMESYILARESAFRALRASAATLNSSIARFAAEHSVRVAETAPPAAGRDTVFAHYGDVYAVFFECYKQEAYLLDAIEHADITAVEQERKALSRVAAEAIAQLDAKQSQPAMLSQSCRSLLTFYSEESEALSNATDFFAAADNFNRMKDVFHTMAPDKRAVDIYFSTLTELGNKEQELSRSLRTLSARRETLMREWNARCAEYLAAAAD